MHEQEHLQQIAGVAPSLVFKHSCAHHYTMCFTVCPMLQLVGHEFGCAWRKSPRSLSKVRVNMSLSAMVRCRAVVMSTQTGTWAHIEHRFPGIS